ncbi:hypothetical protein CEXT_549271 [Caerostris extrusa]|uniref:Uncharacterized protein n=1 Tax=Caerostris extrusa TaxID=172846 RepID=A0AAV4V357_CAEEX|nr:hypothetical protein CEXT_549271 [Caerostris extrusa]
MASERIICQLEEKNWQEEEYSNIEQAAKCIRCGTFFSEKSSAPRCLLFCAAMSNPIRTMLPSLNYLGPQKVQKPSTEEAMQSEMWRSVWGNGASRLVSSSLFSQKTRFSGSVFSLASVVWSCCGTFKL